MKPVNNPITPLQQAILSTLCYFNVFNHPLTLPEIVLNCSLPVTVKETETALQSLVAMEIINNVHGHYFLSEQERNSVAERKEKEKRAEEALRRSKKYTRLISRFPFVKAVSISGSLSKGVMDTDGDVDYFIIAQKGRVWICRSLLIAFKKIFLLNSRKYFCTNYFVDTGHMEIPDKSIFTATEINYLKPVCNKELLAEMKEQNSWTKEFLPNFSTAPCTDCYPENRNALKRLTEKMLSGSLGEYIDNYFFKLTLKRWKKKFPHFNPEDFDLNMRTRKHVSKHHPRGYQQKVLQAHELKLKGILHCIQPKTVAA